MGILQKLKDFITGTQTCEICKEKFWEGDPGSLRIQTPTVDGPKTVYICPLCLFDPKMLPKFLNVIDELLKVS